LHKKTATLKYTWWAKTAPFFVAATPFSQFPYF